MGGVLGFCRRRNAPPSANGEYPRYRKWSFKLDEVEIVFQSASDATRRLAMGIIHRTFTSADQVTQLIQQEGADPNIAPILWAKISRTYDDYDCHPLLSLAIDSDARKVTKSSN
mmetsp:Transcript_13056/g.31193  ORF Transcript_13056/g.31193 Transcript_13056/m.31193 type:complete len:114 (-) Transcript_13056:40-381(-)